MDGLLLCAQRRVKKWRTLLTTSSDKNEVVTTSSAGSSSTRRVNTFYDTRLRYSRLGQYVSPSPLMLFLQQKNIYK